MADTATATPAHPATPTPLRLHGAGAVALAAERYSGADGVPLLYAHGFGQTRQAWSRTAARLAADGHPGLTFDARGHGESDRNPAGLSYAGEQFVDDLAMIVAQYAPKPTLVGASMGGLIGLLTQARHQLFSALVLVDITPRWESAGVERILGFMSAHPDGFDTLAHAAEAIAAYLPHRRGRKSPDQLKALLRRDARGRWRWHWDPRLIAEFARDAERHQDDIAVAARAIDCPVLLISGGRSDLVSERTVEDFRALVPHAEHVHLPQATHMVAGDDNDNFTATLLAYLAMRP